jgi:hypothetical protein
VHYRDLSAAEDGNWSETHLPTQRSIAPLDTVRIVHDYRHAAPEVRITGPGYDRRFFALIHADDQIVVHQSELHLGDG